MDSATVQLSNLVSAQRPPPDFQLPASLEAGEPPEARGLARDEVRLMVSYQSGNRVVHTRFRDLPHLLEAGDALVVNTSGTMNAALEAVRPDGTTVEAHLSTHLPGDIWTVEVRKIDGATTKRLYAVPAGESLALPAGGSLTLHLPYSPDRSMCTDPAQTRLWIATLELPSPIMEYLARYGSPIRYGYVKRPWPISYYQTVYATEVGSAEMPSAGRAFTPDLLTRLVVHGVQVLPLLLHTGVASPEAGELPYEEYYRVPLETARLVNLTRQAGGRVIAVGTTVVRALETVTDVQGTTHPGEGWTCLVVSPERGIRSVDGLLTGLHEPRSSHLAMLEALAGPDHLGVTYAAALKERYLWHEFGDLHLILP